VIKRVIEHGYKSRSVSAEQALEELVNIPLANGASLQRGFTMTELITVMVIIGILAAMVAPRFFEKNAFDSRGFYDQTISTLRYAQKAAIAKHRYVCATITSTNITLTMSTLNECGATTTLDLPGGGNETCNHTAAVANVLNAPCNVTITPSLTIYFDPLGRPIDPATTQPVIAQQTITISGYTTSIFVEKETGYVH
jgi:MSHA pilin protein MshC